jgi:hypothetical protein
MHKKDKELLEEPEEWFRDRLDAWLKRKDWRLEELVEFLEGFGIPATQDGGEPYLSLLEALPEDASRYTAETELARRAAALLDKVPDTNEVGDPSERLLYNLLFLCAGLSCPDELAETLSAMWHRKALTGEWQGLDLRYALTVALIANQLDSRMATEWKAMRERRPCEFLVGQEYDGFEGALWMPASPSKRGEPFLDAIGEALKNMAIALENNPNCRSEFRNLVRKVKETYPDWPNWDRDLILLADRYAFPVWAVECLPRLFFVVGYRKTWFQLRSTKIVLMWNVLAFCLPRGCRQRQAFCDGLIVEVELTERVYARLSKTASSVEKLRLDFPYRSERGLRGAVGDLLEQIRISKRRVKERELVKGGRPIILRKNKVGFADRIAA